MTTLLKVLYGFNPLKSFLTPKPDFLEITCRSKHRILPKPKKRFPPWLIKSTRSTRYEDELTSENKTFLKQLVQEKYPRPESGYGSYSPLNLNIVESAVEWSPSYQRAGLIARKIGVYPMWMKDGRKVLTTLFQVADNHVIKYQPPETYKPMITKRKTSLPPSKGSLIIGADSADPQLFTKEYCGLFEESGVMPKRLLARFHVSPEAALQPGTPLLASHFKVGQYVDIRGKTINRGFQGVMKRWGFHGMPASHGVTKTHRRPGNIGSGGKKARVMPGTKMPGHMGNRYRVLKAQRIVRINTKYNVLWVLGSASPGECNSCVQIFDTVLPLKNCNYLKQTPYFPTYYPGRDEELPEELMVDDLHNFNDPTIMFTEDEE
ncbi:hypothetical protein TKK_0003491 [Trichogramma kaykai]|uniref:Large ribosomal subunit protein uL3m n=1 Tax=Trichogramma kaykai TaxID=54128 RepID=A0ABD2XRQ9_9HYME